MAAQRPVVREPGVGGRTKSMGWHLERRLWQGLVVVILCTVGVFLMVPFYWMVATSLKVESEVYRFPPVWIPSRLAWENYYYALIEIMPFPTFFANTLHITVFSTVGAVLSSSMVAFAFARLRWPGRDKLFVVILATMMVPSYSTIVPVFILFRMLNWIDTFKPLIVPSWCGGAFFIFLMRQFYMTLPLDLDEAARMDGASDWRIWWSVIMPLARPAVATVAIYNFMDKWNEFFGPLIFLTSLRKFTVALGLNMFRVAAASYGVRYHWLMAASVAVLLPCLLVFFFAQKTFIQGVVMSGIKG